MDGQKFDELVRGLATGSSRRRVLKGIGGGALAGALSLVGMRRGRAQEEDLECAAKVGICHHSDKKAKFQYIEVCVDAVPAHAAHGDLVACPNLEVIDPETCTCICPVEDIVCDEGEELDEDLCLCVPINECTTGFVCGSAIFCAGGSCLCTAVLEGGAVCAPDFTCGTPQCTSSEECVTLLGPGSFCQAPGTGCCGQVCVPAGVCEAGTAAAASLEGPTNSGGS